MAGPAYKILLCFSGCIPHWCCLAGCCVALSCVHSDVSARKSMKTGTKVGTISRLSEVDKMSQAQKDEVTVRLHYCPKCSRFACTHVRASAHAHPLLFVCSSVCKKGSWHTTLALLRCFHPSAAASPVEMDTAVPTWASSPSLTWPARNTARVCVCVCVHARACVHHCGVQKGCFCCV